MNWSQIAVNGLVMVGGLTGITEVLPPKYQPVAHSFFTLAVGAANLFQPQPHKPQEKDQTNG